MACLKTAFYYLNRKSWNDRLLQALQPWLHSRDRTALLSIVSNCKTFREFLRAIVVFGQEQEMIGSLARAQNRQDEYIARLQLAASCYAFTASSTKDMQIQERMKKAEAEIVNRLC